MPRKKSAARHWCDLDVHGTKYKVYLTSKEVFEPLDGADGVTIPDHSLIAIDESLEETRMRVTLIHELLHACLSAPGSATVLPKILSCTKEDSLSREEDLVSYLAPLLCDTLERNGMLKMPKLPRKR